MPAERFAFHVMSAIYYCIQQRGTQKYLNNFMYHSWILFLSTRYICSSGPSSWCHCHLL
jgi:hypothetical protein